MKFLNYDIGYIELFYNRKHMHSTLDYMSPVEYRLKYNGREVANNHDFGMQMAGQNPLLKSRRSPLLRWRIIRFL